MKSRGYGRRNAIGRPGGHFTGPVEPYIRLIAADLLGVDPAQLRSDISLVDDLAADSLDLLEVTLSLERELGISVPERQLEAVRTYGELAGLAARLVAEQSRRTLAAGESRVVSALTRLLDDSGRSIIERAGPITPYDAEVIAQHASGARRAKALHVIVPGDTSDTAIADVDRLFSRLERLGVRVSVFSQGTIEPVPRELALRTVRHDHPLAVAAEGAARARELMHELQKERAMVALAVVRGRSLPELNAQLAQTTRSLADARAFLASRGASRRNPTVAHLAAAVELFARLEPVRAAPAGHGRDVGTITDAYSRVTARLLDAIASLAPLAPQNELAGRVAAYVAFACAKEEMGLEGAEVAYVLATGSFDPGHELALAALMAAERSSLTLFTATAPPDILIAYRDRAADPVFDEVASVERMALKQGGALRADASAWLHAVTAKLDLLKEIGDAQSCAIIAAAG